MNANIDRSGNISTNSHPNSRIRSPAHISNARHSAPASASASAPASAPVSASAQLVFANNVNANANANANTSIQTPVSSSPVSTLRLQEGYAIPESSFRLSTPQLLTSFRQESPLHNEHNENGNEISLVIDIPHDNDNSNSNIILNTDSVLESSPGGSQFGSM